MITVLYCITCSNIFRLGSELEMQLRTVGLQRFSGTPWEISRMLGADLIVLLTATLTFILRSCAWEPRSRCVGREPVASAHNANTPSAPAAAAPGDCASVQGEARGATMRRERAASAADGRTQVPSFMSVQAHLQRFNIASTYERDVRAFA